MPRLKAGQTAESITKIQQEKERIVRAIIAVLEEALKKPSTVPEELRKAFKSERRLASWDARDRGIRPTAVNTLRKYIAKHYPGGIKAFTRDRLRLLREASEDHAPPGTKRALQQTVNKLREQHRALNNYILQFSAQYLDLLQKVSHLARGHKPLNEDLKAHIRAYPNAHHGFYVVKDGGRHEE